MKFLDQIRDRGILFFVLFLGMFIVYIGASFNFLAVLENGGRMPVQGIPATYEKHFAFEDKDEVNFYYFTDIIKIRNYYVSIGDIILLMGAMVLVLALVYECNKIRMEVGR